MANKKIEISAKDIIEISSSNTRHIDQYVGSLITDVHSIEYVRDMNDNSGLIRTRSGIDITIAKPFFLEVKKMYLENDV